MSEVINNVLTQNANGNSSSAVRQQVFNENRTMFLQMMAPVTQQLNDMKLVYENSKSASSDIGDKIDELKKIIAMQSAPPY